MASEGWCSAEASVTMGEASLLRSWDLAATSSGHGLQKSPAGSSKANLPSAGLSGEMQRGKRLRSKRVASDLHPLPERRAAASLMCFETPQPALFILHQQTHAGECHITLCQGTCCNTGHLTCGPQGPGGAGQGFTMPWLSLGRIPEKQGILSGEKCRLALPLNSSITAACLQFQLPIKRRLEATKGILVF